MIHDLMPGQPSSVHQQLESEFQPGIHLPSSRFPLAFFSSALRVWWRWHGLFGFIPIKKQNGWKDKKFLIAQGSLPSTTWIYLQSLRYLIPKIHTFKNQLIVYHTLIEGYYIQKEFDDQKYLQNGGRVEKNLWLSNYASNVLIHEQSL